MASKLLSRGPIHEMEALVREAWAGIDGASTVELRLGKLPAARGDRKMLGRVWTNLLANAVRFCTGREHPRIEVTGGQGADYAVYGVRDNGAGLATVHRLVACHRGID